MSARFVDCQAANRLRLLAKKDRLLWEYAKDKGFTIITFDEDFEVLSQARGYPPKVILLRPGTLSASQTTNLLELNFETICEFLKESNTSGVLKLVRIGI